MSPREGGNLLTAAENCSNEGERGGVSKVLSRNRKDYSLWKGEYTLEQKGLGNREKGIISSHAAKKKKGGHVTNTEGERRCDYLGKKKGREDHVTRVEKRKKETPYVRRKNLSHYTNSHKTNF